ETGGRVIEVGNKMDKLKQAFDQVAQELRSQYNVGYTPTNAALDGTFRKVEIHANSKDYKIQARSGYYSILRKDGCAARPPVITLTGARVCSAAASKGWLGDLLCASPGLSFLVHHRIARHHPLQREILLHVLPEISRIHRVSFKVA